MTVNLFTFVDLYDRLLASADHLLTKGEAYAREKGIDPETILTWRLIDDMEPLSFQIMVVCNFAKQWPARAADLPVPADIGRDLNLAGFRTEIVTARAWLKALAPEHFTGREDVEITVSLGNGTLEPTLSVARWLTVFATTNLYFHLSTAYGILRSRGVQIGKPDLFSTGL